MRWLRVLCLIGTVAVAVTTAASGYAKPLTADHLKQAGDDPNAWLVDGKYVRGEAKLARMRRAGELPDRIRAGQCVFALAGDVGVAYYVRTCH